MTRVLEGLTLWQALNFIVLCLMLRFLYEIKISLITSNAWQKSHEELDKVRFASLGLKEEA